MLLLIISEEFSYMLQHALCLVRRSSRRFKVQTIVCHCLLTKSLHIFLLY